jgi:hypothetical protein
MITGADDVRGLVTFKFSSLQTKKVLRTSIAFLQQQVEDHIQIEWGCSSLV